MRSFLLILFAFFFVNTAQSSLSDIKDETIFSCDINGGKRLVLSSVGNSLVYSFEKLGEKLPELFFANSKDNVEVGNMTGENGETYYSVDMKNSGYVYRVLFGRKNSNVGLGVQIEKDGNLIAEKYCKEFEKIQNEERITKSTKNTNIKVTEGTYRVGIDIPAGEYKLIETDHNFGGFYRVYLDSSDKRSSIVTGGPFKNQTFVTVKKGQYLELSDCTAEKVK